MVISNLYGAHGRRWWPALGEVEGVAASSGPARHRRTEAESQVIDTIPQK